VGGEGGEEMSEIANDMVAGACCCLCGVYFEEENGYPVLCRSCWAGVKGRARGRPPITEEGWQETQEKEL